MKHPCPTAVLTLAALLAAAVPAAGQTVTVTTAADVIDVDWQTATVADLPGPDGVVSFSEAMIATNNTPGHQTVGFAIPPSEWTLQFVLPGRAVLQSVTGYFFRAHDAVTIDGTTQTAFSGDTNPDGNEVAIYGLTLYLNADDSTLIGFDSTNVQVGGSSSVVQGNTGSMNITVFGGSGSLIQGNQGGTIKLDRTHDNVVVGNTVSRVRVLGGGPDAVGNRIGGPAIADRNFITGYGTWNSEGYPNGAAVQLFRTVDTVIENNWIGTTPDGLAIGNLACSQGILLETHNQDVVVRDNLIAGIKGLGIGPHAAGLLFGRAILASGTGSGLTITGNTIGIDANGDPLLGSVTGIDLGDPVTHTLTMTGVVVGGSGPGEGNEIAGHVLNGVLVGRSTPAVRLAGNSIHDNGALGIDLVPSGYGYGVSPNDALDADTGGNGMQNFPGISAVLREGTGLRVTGALHSSPADDFTLEFFATPAADASGFGEGRTPLGSAAVTTDASGDAPFDLSLAGPVDEGWFITSTATREPDGATSEFSAAVATVWRDEGHGLAGIRGLPRLVGTGTLQPGSTAAIELGQACESAPAFLIIGVTTVDLPLYGGTLVPGFEPPAGFIVPMLTGADGGARLQGTWPATLPSGFTTWFQYWIADAAGPYGFAASNALSGTTP